MFRKLFFSLQYLLNNPPWDTGITPPELFTFLEKKPPGRALDLGCGTGTNALTMAKFGWQVTGIDYVPRAIRAARRKVDQAGFSNQVEFLAGDIFKIKRTDNQYDLILDIGCFHSLAGSEVQRYAGFVSKLLVPGGSLLMYAHLKRIPGSSHGVSERDLDEIGSVLSLIWRQDGLDGASRPSTWLQFQAV
jgi:cyclopropane fatty-acyl-phospholipid synthase-like methyltransferase